MNRVTEYTDPSGAGITYTYDENSNLKTITYPGGKQVIYDYNLNNQLVTVTDWEDRITTYEYDHNGRLILTARPDGSAETREYYDNGKLKQLKDVDADNDIISQYDYTYDAAGNITDDNNSNEAGPYTFDSAAQTYDADNRLGSYNGQTVTYDADGNMTRGPLAGDMENFTFDARSRLTVAGDTSYTYDAGNKRISVSHGTHQTTYTVNPNAFLSQVLTATDESDHKTYYVYGLGLIGQESPDGAYKNYHFDHLGSTIALTSESGSVTDRFQYAPYGELIYRSGNTATPFLFNGQYGVMTDASDLYYMRARYYNPVAKRFLSPDTLVGQISNPQSQNRYVYCEGNPANYVDPTGHWQEGDEKLAQWAQDAIITYTIQYKMAELNDDKYGMRDAHNMAEDVRNFIRTGKYKSRSDWGAFPSKLEPPLEPINTNRDDYYYAIVFHHTERPAKEDIKDLQLYFLNHARFSDIAYHFVIGYEGTVYEGRSLDYKGAHVDDNNTGKIGISLMGNFEHHDTFKNNLKNRIQGAAPTYPTIAQIDSAYRLERFLSDAYGINTVGGHKDFASPGDTLCPGDNLTEKLLRIYR